VRFIYPQLNDSLSKQLVLVKLAKAYIKSGKSDLAIDCLMWAIKLDTMNPYPFYKLGAYMFRQRQFQEAQDNLSKAYSLQQDNLKILIKLGQSFSMQGDIRSAKTFFAQGLLLD